MTTKMEDYILKDNEVELRKLFRDTMAGQFERELYSKFFSNHLESDEIDTLQQRIEWWMVVVDRGARIPNDVYDYSFDELYKLFRKARDPEMQEFVKALRDRHMNS